VGFLFRLAQVVYGFCKSLNVRLHWCTVGKNVQSFFFCWSHSVLATLATSVLVAFSMPGCYLFVNRYNREDLF
jgi:hypothetical protein